MATTKTRPTATPLDDIQTPPEPTQQQLAAAQISAGTTAAASGLDTPTMSPPGTASAASAAAAGWLTNKHVLMTWQTSGPLDNWAFIDGGTGWRHLTQSGDVAIRGMALLAAGARASGGAVQLYEGAGGAIDAMYLW
jgi:hypothetical protein